MTKLLFREMWIDKKLEDTIFNNDWARAQAVRYLRMKFNAKYGPCK